MEQHEPGRHKQRRTNSPSGMYVGRFATFVIRLSLRIDGSNAGQLSMLPSGTQRDRVHGICRHTVALMISDPAGVRLGSGRFNHPLGGGG